VPNNKNVNNKKNKNKMTTTDLVQYQKTVSFNQENYIPIKPVCDLFGINYKHQSLFIRNHKYLSTAVGKTSQRLPQGGGNMPQLLLSKPAFIFWVFQLNTEIVKNENKDPLIDFQANLLEYMYANTENRINTLKQKVAIHTEIMNTMQELEGNEAYLKLMDLKAQEMRLGKEIKEYDKQILAPVLFAE
jgi:P22_AR N-terminal domain